ncbi:MAG: helicase-related protein [Candidatus Altiarchaeota archaeon]
MNCSLLDFIEKEGKFFIIDGFIKHSKIKVGILKAREFQVKIAEKALKRNTLVVLPTGLGKTIIAAMVAAEILNSKKGKILFLAPTKPLVMQHMQTFEKILALSEEESMAIFTGEINVRERVAKFDRSRIIFSTPQIIKNDTSTLRYSLKDVDLLIIDEAHRASGKYAYVHIAKEFSNLSKGLILAMTASPGSKRKKIMELIKNLNISQVEVRTREDIDVRNYVKEIKIFWEKVSLDEKQKEMQKIFYEILKERIEKLQRLGFLSYKKAEYVSKKDLLLIEEKIRKMLSNNKKKGYLFGIMQNQIIALFAYHCSELLETQGILPLYDYLNRIRKKEKLSKAEKAFINDKRIEKIFSFIENFSLSKTSHPKIQSLLKVVSEQLNEKQDSLILIFSQYRDTINSLFDELKKLPNVKAIKFIGQSSRHGRKGLSQKEQKEILEKFKAHEYNTLIASSVAEEGLDIPNVDLVVFYEPIPSEIRAIQRRGRTGRINIGKVVILITDDSKDEAYLNAEIQREKKMQKIVEWLKKQSNFSKI